MTVGISGSFRFRFSGWSGFGLFGCLVSRADDLHVARAPGVCRGWRGRRWWRDGRIRDDGLRGRGLGRAAARSLLPGLRFAFDQTEGENETEAN